MTAALGLLFAFGAFLFWGFGDFLIQRSTRKLGDWETLFVITAFGTVVLMPFVYKDIGFVFSFQDSSFWLLLLVAAVLFIAALLDFEALKHGKLSIIEPIMALEVPVAAILSTTIIREQLSWLEIVLMAILVLGLVGVSIKAHHLKSFKARSWLERGVVLVALGSIFMGISNVAVGFASRVTSPLLTNWFINAFIATVSIIYILYNNRLQHLSSDFKKNKKLIFPMSAIDNAAWICFAFAASMAPIAIVVAITESYIALAALLGMMVNRERLMHHQKAGLVAALASAVILAVMTAG